MEEKAKRKVIWITTYWKSGIEPVVSPFDNSEAAEICARYYKRQGYKVCIDECDIFHKCIEQNKDPIKETETQGILWEGLTATQGPVKIRLDSECLSLTLEKIQIAVPVKAVIEIIKKEPKA